MEFLRRATKSQATIFPYFSGKSGLDSESDSAYLDDIRIPATKQIDLIFRNSLK